MLNENIQKINCFTYCAVSCFNSCSGMAATTQVTPWTHLNYDVCGQDTTSIDGDIIAFSTKERQDGNFVDLNNDGNISSNVIGYRNIKTKETVILPYEGYAPNISESKIAFISGPRLGWQPEQTIKIYDINTKNLLDTGITDYNYGWMVSPRYFSNNVITYVDIDGIVKYVDFNTGKTGSTGLTGLNPYIDNGKIVFSDSYNRQTGNIYYFDISTQRLIKIGNGWDARVFGDKILWTELNEYEWNWENRTKTGRAILKLYDTITAEVETINLSSHYETNYAGAFLDGDYLVYQSSYTNDGIVDYGPPGTISYYNIKTKVTKSITVDNPAGVCCFFGSSNGVIVFEVYQNDTDYDCDLGYAYLPINVKDGRDNNQSNHGQYVSSVAKSAVSQKGKGQVVNEAARAMDKGQCNAIR